MTSAAQKNKSSITLKGSADIVCDYLNYGINSILFQRGLYPSEEFQNTQSYGLTILMSTNNKIKEFITEILTQTKEWLIKRSVRKISMVITNVKTLEVLERWDFNVEYEGEAGDETQTSEKPLKQVQMEIREVLRQIASSIAYLPLLDCLCGFDLQIYTNKNVDMPEKWAESEAASIKNAQIVKMRTFTTDIHKMETVVTYKNEN